ncbi:MAG: alpha-galactosidase [bacterium]|jgi:alpha-galactosidase
MNCSSFLRLFVATMCLFFFPRIAGLGANPVLSVEFHQGGYFDEPLFSFTYDGKGGAELLPGWKPERSSRKLDDQRTERRVLWTEPTTGLEVRWVGVEYQDFQAVEWTVYFKNTGKANTPILQGIQALDLGFQRSQDGEFVLHGTKGDWCTPESFQPFQQTLEPKGSRRFAPFGGRPTNAAFPYYNLQMPGGGVLLAIGWPGEWAGSFDRDSDRGLHVTAGQELFHSFLKPGEEIRSPLIAMLFWKGADHVTAQNLWRRWMVAHNLPRTADGNLPPTQIVACSSHQFKEMTQANEDNQKLFVDRYLEEGMKLDYWWMDAGWYPCGGEWVKTGTWEPDVTRFPKGLRAVSDHARAKGVKTIVWFEPERVGDPNSWIGKNYPEWLLSKKAELPPPPQGGGFGSGPGSLLNLGNPEALKWLINHVDRTLTEQGIDFYRQDFNMDPLTFWRGADAPDRQGMTENLYVQGYLAYWDALRQRHPNLRIDSCASGGRRDDLETMRRAVPLIRSDYLFEPTSQQNHHFAFASWIPYHGAGFVAGHSAIGFKVQDEIDPYAFRANMSPSLTLCYDMRRKDLNYELARRLFTQLKQIGPNYLGDFYPLTPYSLANDAWLAWQYDRPESHEGLVQAFRRPDSNFEAARFKLRGLEAGARYIVTDLDRPSEPQTFTGEELAKHGLLITIPSQPGAVVLTYKQVTQGVTTNPSGGNP